MPVPLDALDADLLNLSPTTTLGERLELVAKIIDYWQGPLSAEPGVSPTALTLPLPAPLAWWLDRYGSRGDLLWCGNGLPMHDVLRMEGADRLVFHVETQGVYVWATEPQGEDPPVWGRINEEDEPWLLEVPTVSEFLITAALFGGPSDNDCGAFASWLGERGFQRIVPTLTPLPLTPWRWPEYPTTFYGRGGAFMWASPNGVWDGEQGYTVGIGAKMAEPLRFIKDIVTEDWEWVAL
jgi:hypothetical protein